jgi:hypothetical protein
MAQIEQPSRTQVENPGAYYTQDYSLETLNFLTASGQKFEMKKILVELSYYEDIYSFVVSGYVKIVDAQGFIELLQLNGTNFIELSFSKIKNASNKNKQIFRVYKIDGRKPSGNMNAEHYTLHFCSEELLLSEQIKISKEYTGKKISSIINDILVEKLKVKPKYINTIEETTGMYDFIIPTFKPFEAISWLSNYARPNMTGAIGADMLFFETKDGFYFRSLQSMYKQSIYATYKYQAKNLPGKTPGTFQSKATTVIDYEFVKTYDMVDDIQSGTFASRLISLDPMARTAKTTDFKYTDYKKASFSLNPGNVSNQLVNRLGLTQEQTPQASIKVSTGNSSQSNAPYIKQIPGSVAKDIAVETYIPNRTAQIALANYTVLKVRIPGDSGITAGRTINFNLYSLKPSEKRQLDEFYSGKYLVTAVRHVIQPTAYQTFLEIAKDSTPKNYNNIVNTSEMKKAAAD